MSINQKLEDLQKALHNLGLNWASIHAVKEKFAVFRQSLPFSLLKEHGLRKLQSKTSEGIWLTYEGLSFHKEHTFPSEIEEAKSTFKDFQKKRWVSFGDVKQVFAGDFAADKNIMDWQIIFALQDKFYPNWRTKLSHTLYSTALCGEVGEICSTITHLEGGGTNNRKYTKESILHQCVDSWIQIVLLLGHYGFSSSEFLAEYERVVSVELPERLDKRLREARTRLN